MPSFGAQWNPYDVLKIVKTRTRCYGRAPSKGRQCENPIALANREKAQQLLAEISSLDPASPNLSRHLQKLAHLLLCQRNHQNQASDVVRQWKEDIEQFLHVEVERNILEAQVLAEIARQIVRERRRQSAPAQSIESSIRNLITILSEAPLTASQTSRSGGHASRRSSFPGSAETTRRNTASVATATTSPALQRSSNHASGLSSQVNGGTFMTTEPIATSSRPTQTLPADTTASETTSRDGDTSTSEATSRDRVAVATQATDAQNEIQTTLGSAATTFSPPASPVGTRSTSVAPSEATTEAETVSSLRVEPSNSPISDEASSDNSPSERAASVNEQTPSEEPVPNDTRTLSGDCSICYDDLLDGRCIVSCRTQCRQYFHQSCIRTWLREGSSQTCPHWYVACFVGLGLWLTALVF